ncbi:oligosaccharide flippase family protein [Mycolicibacterium sp.]|uniref:lipopolysaccharide biosynthesis protein n=1 Tax=Mycolicibacterium sp. TaxID=2320850 RepID=UPI0028B16F08|nr:oligosaccharide flippase family protein [Mycolicibacterium sp.]
MIVDTETRRNFFAYYANFIATAVIGLLINPALLGALGPLMFGLWKSLQRYLDFATLADGRSSQALKWIVAGRDGLSPEEKRRDVGAAILVWFQWFPAAALAVGGITLAIPFLVKDIPPEAMNVAYVTAAILSANTVLVGLLSTPDSVLVGVNQGYKTMLISIGALVVGNAAVFGVAYLGSPLWALALALLCVAVVKAVCTLFVTRRAVPWWGVARPTKSDLKRVRSFSAWTIGSTIVDKLFSATEFIVISIMIGAVAVSQYTFTTYVMQFVLTIALVTASGFMPVLGKHYGASELGAAAEGARSVRHFVVGVAALGSAAVMAFNGAFVNAWGGAGQYMGNTINALLVLCALQFALIRMDGQILDVTMRVAPKVLVGLASSAGGIAAGCTAFVLTHSLTVALIAVIAARMAGSVMYPIFVARLIPGSGVPWRPVVLSVILLPASVALGPIVEDGSVLLKAALALAWLAMAGLTVWLGIVPRSMVSALLSRSRKSEPVDD